MSTTADAPAPIAPTTNGELPTGAIAPRERTPPDVDQSARGYAFHRPRGNA